MIIFKDATIGYTEGQPIIKGLNLEVQEGEFVTLIGESGSGKTTLLKSINGLVPLSGGTLEVLGKPLSQWDIHTLRRRIGYVIQQIGLFPHMTVGENIAYVASLTKSKPYYSVDAMLDLVNMPRDYQNRYPRELSGGQKQRVGVARALSANPDLLLMDEPFGAVDEITRATLQEELKNIQEQLKKTIVFVTHDLEEALKLGQRIVLFKDGQIEQMGTRHQMVFEQGSAYVTKFFNDKHLTAYFNLTPVGDMPLEPLVSGQEYQVISFKTTIIQFVNMKMHDGRNLPYAVEKEGRLIGVVPDFETLLRLPVTQ